MEQEERWIKELIVLGSLKDYEDIIKHYVSNINKMGFIVASIDYGTQSKIDWDSNYIILARGKKKELILYDFLHEYGHLLSGEPKESEMKTLERELLAWEYAFKELNKWEKLKNLCGEMKKYKNFCIIDYVK